MCRPPSGRREARIGGFTLIEILVAVMLVAGVLGATYEIVMTTIDAARRMERISRPAKIGESILSLIRRDLECAAAYGLGDRIFLGEDRDEGENARDGIHFISTVKPLPTGDAAYAKLEEWHLVSVSYVLADRPGSEGFILFRREGWEPQGNDLLDGGAYREVYDRLAYLDFDYLDVNGEWFESWDSQERRDLMEVIDKPQEAIIGGELTSDLEKKEEEAKQKEKAKEELQAKAKERTPSTTRVGGGAPAGARPVAIANPLDAASGPEEVEELPDPGIPRAVRIRFGIYVGDEKGLWTDDAGRPIVYPFSGTVELLASELLPIRVEVPEEAAAGASGGTGATAEEQDRVDRIVSGGGGKASSAKKGADRKGDIKGGEVRGGRRGEGRRGGRGGAPFGGGGGRGSIPQGSFPGGGRGGAPGGAELFRGLPVPGGGGGGFSTGSLPRNVPLPKNFRPSGR